MKRLPVQTADGSFTLFDPKSNQHFHSLHGALQESLHVFIEMGLNTLPAKSKYYVFEMGFGSGLNAALALDWSLKQKKILHYTGIEKFPLDKEEWLPLEIKHPEYPWKWLHQNNWNISSPFGHWADVLKIQMDFSEISLPHNQYDCIFYDAFAPEAQPELWTVEVFQKLYSCLVDGGIWVTYCAKGQVRRNLLAAGFLVERCPGPPGKREMLRAVKPKKSR